jgi:sugar phosphate isomerase/epimerase
MDESGSAERLRAMRLSLNRTVVAGGQVTWAEFLDLGARYGYDAVDLPRLTELANDPVELTVERLAAHRLVAGPAIMPVRFAGEREVFEDGFAQLEGHVALAEAVGCRDLLAILPASSEVPKAELRPLVVERLRACAEVLADHGLRLAVEFYGPLHMRQLHPYLFVFSLGETLEVVGYYGFVSPEVFGPRLAEVSPDDGARLALEGIGAAMTAGAAQLTSSRASAASSS